MPKLSKEFIGNSLSAVHSGKLGDIIYALPTCRALGIDELLLSPVPEHADRLRIFTHEMAREMIPLLNEQPYLKKALVTEGKPITDYNFDFFREVPRHRIGELYRNFKKEFFYSANCHPVHLGEHFAGVFGIQVDLTEPWIFAEPSTKTQGKVVVSITRNWRSYSDYYWKFLLAGLPEVIFVGLEAEAKKIKLPNAKFISSEDHKELAALIAGSSLFLGTVSFPYALAEGMKVKRGVEVCYRNMNAFPVGERGFMLPPDVIAARKLVAKELGLESHHAYVRKTVQLTRRPDAIFYSLLNKLRVFTTPTNQSRQEYLFTSLRTLLPK
jgi:hypothetical protein